MKRKKELEHKVKENKQEEYQIISEKLFKSELNKIQYFYNPSSDYNGNIVIREKEFRFPIAEINPRTGSQSNLLLGGIIFFKCKFNESVNFGNYYCCGKVKFDQCIFNGPLSIKSGNSEHGNCTFNDNFSINFSEESEAEINDLNVGKKFEIAGSLHTLILKNINKDVKINSQSIAINVQCGSVTIHSVYATSLEFLNGCILNGKISIEEISVTNLSIQRARLNNEMEVLRSSFDTLTNIDLIGNSGDLRFNECKTTVMRLKLNMIPKTSILQSTITSLEISDMLQVESLLNIEKTTINNLDIRNLYNNGRITLSEITIANDGILSFKSSNLGKTDFIKCDFSQAILEFENCKIAEAFFSETDFPKRSVVNGKKNYGQEQLIFGQLATAFQKQGDNVRALEYSSRELEAHYRKLRWLSHNFFEKLNLSLNSISNNFGRSWIRGIGFSISIGIIFFCLLLISTDRYVWGWPTLEWNILPAYFKFMNPLRFIELEEIFKNTPLESKIGLGSTSYFLDFMGRIFLAYGFFQTIQAFRRFGRR